LVLWDLFPKQRGGFPLAESVLTFLTDEALETLDAVGKTGRTERLKTGAM